MVSAPSDQVSQPSVGLAREPSLWTAAACGLILIFAAGLRFLAARGDFWLDEIWSWVIAANVHGGWDILTDIHHDNNHYLNTWWIHLLGLDRHWGLYRIPAVIAGVGAVAVAGLIGNRQSKWEGLSAMLLMAVSYLQVHYASEARGYSCMVFFALLSFYLLDRILKEPRGWRTVVFVGSVVLGFLSHLQFIFCYAGLVSWSLWRLVRTHDDRRQLLRVVCQCHLIPVLFLAWLYSVDISSMEFAGGDQHPITEILVKLLSLMVGGPASGAVAVSLAVLVLLAIVSALRLLREEGSDEWVFYLVTLFIAPMCIPLIMRHDLFFVRYFMLCSTFALLLINHLISRIAGWRRLGRLLSFLMILAFLAGNSVHVVRLTQLGRGQYQQAIQFMNDKTQGPMVVVSSDYAFRNLMMLSFYQSRNSSLKPIAHLSEGQVSSDGPEWFILNDVEQNSAPAKVFRGPGGNRYQLAGEYPYAGLSGWKWVIYRNENRTASDE